MNENPVYQGNGYWSNQNIGDCYMNMLEDLEERCSNRKLLNYFNHTENIMAKKDPGVLNELKSFAEQRRMNLMHLKLSDYKMTSRIEN